MNYFEEHLCGLKLPLITIYNKPSDYPTKFVARLWDTGKTTDFFVLADTLELIRKSIPPHMVKLPRAYDDDNCISEVYI